MFSNPMDLWDKVISVKLSGTYMSTRYCAEYMIKTIEDV
jgi:hypothetical protein